MKHLSIKTTLALHDLEVPVELGYSVEERSRKQIVLVNLEIKFKQPPKACISDEIQATINYDPLINNIRTNIASKQFHLLEHLTYEIYQIIKSIVIDQANISVSVTKQPIIQGLRKGASFSYQDGD